MGYVRDSIVLNIYDLLHRDFMLNKDTIIDNIYGVMEKFINDCMIYDFRILSVEYIKSSIIVNLNITRSDEYSDEELLTITYEVDNAPF